MAPGQDQLLEKLVDGALRSSNFQPLDVFLEDDLSQRKAIHCSKQFLCKVDKLVNVCLDHKDAKHASLCLTILYKCGKKLSFPGGVGASGIIAQGFVKKMVGWFGKCRQLWIQQGPKRDEALLTLCEDFFDSLMAVHEISKEATYQVTEVFLHPIGQLAAHPLIYILIKKEAIRKLNMVLDKIPEELKKQKKILSSQEASDVMSMLAGQILDGGDYDFQTALMEALCRMATTGQRKEMVHSWFSMDFVAKAFMAIRDAEFETDCRTFLNLVNGIQGDSRRVFSYPCLEAFLDEHELLMPSDEKLEQFWIDFNLGSQSLSFYFAVAEEEAKEGQWDTICITENEVISYTLMEEAKCRVLRLSLCEVVCVGVAEGTSLTIRFSLSLDVLHAIRAIYGRSKDKGFVGKHGTSVVTTTVKILMEDSCSQPVVPESQVSLITDMREGNTTPCWLAPPAAPVQLINPARRRISESTTFISGSTGGSVCDGSPYSVVLPAVTPGRVKGKPAPEMVRSGERQGGVHLAELSTSARTPSVPGPTSSSIRAEHRTKLLGHSILRSERSKQNVKGAQEEEPELLEHSFVPDSQPVATSKGNTISNWPKHSVADMLMMMPVQRNKHLSRPDSKASMERRPEPLPSLDRALGSGSDLNSHKRLHSELSQRLQDVINQINLDSEGEAPASLQGKRPPNDRDAPQRDREPAVRCPSSNAATTVAPDMPGSANKKQRGKGAPELVFAKDTSVAHKTVPAKVLQERSLNPKVKSAPTVSAKQRKDAALADSMVKLISSRYDGNKSGISKAPSADLSLVSSSKLQTPSWIPPSLNKSIFERSWLPSAQKEGQKATCFTKSYFNPRKKSMGNRGDIFAFKPDRSSNTGGKASESSALETSSSMLVPGSLSCKKGPPEPKGKRYVRQHLFSDTDPDQSNTDVSWLRDSSRRPKPKVTDYTRTAPANTTARAPNTTYESPDPPIPPPIKDHPLPLQKRPRVKGAGEQPDRQPSVPSRAAPAGRRPRRAAATNAKSYREPDTDDSLSQTEWPPAAKKPPSVELQARRGQTNEEAERKTGPSSAYKSNNQKVERHGRDSHTDKELPAPSKSCTTGRRVEGEKTQSKPTGAARTSSTFTQQPTKTHQVSHSRPDVELPPGPKQTTESAGQWGLKRGRTGPRPQQQTGGQKASWTSRLAPCSPCPPPLETMRSAGTLTLASAISPLSPLLGSPGSRRPTLPDTLHQRGRGGGSLSKLTARLPRPVAAGNAVSKTAVPASLFYGGQGKRGLATAPPLRTLPALPASETPAGRPAAQHGLRRGCVTELSPIRRPLSLAPPSPPSPSSQASQPILTSTGLDPAPSPPSLQHLPAPGGGRHKHGFKDGSSKESLGSSLTLSLSSVRSSTAISKMNADTCTVLEETPSSTMRPHHVSGPTHRHAPSSPHSSSDAEEEEQVARKKGKRMRQRSPKMMPRKLFKSFTKAQANGQTSEDEGSSEEERDESTGFKPGPTGYRTTVKNKSTNRTTQNTVPEVPPAGVSGGIGRVVSSAHTLTTRTWVDVEDKENVDPDDQDQDDEDQEDEDQGHKDPEDEDLEDDVAHSPGYVGAVCRQFGSKLQRKFQNRSRRMERYSKQSAQTGQRHVSNLGTQVNKYRAQRLQLVRQVLHEEISLLEQDNATLKSMEKELTVYWRKQTTAFHSYLENDKRRKERLKDALQDSKTYSLEYEGKIFTSQMSLMMKDMKSVQDGLFKEMQEEEIHSVRRGLRALFMPEGGIF